MINLNVNVVIPENEGDDPGNVFGSSGSGNSNSLGGIDQPEAGESNHRERWMAALDADIPPAVFDPSTNCVLVSSQMATLYNCFELPNGQARMCPDIRRVRVYNRCYETMLRNQDTTVGGTTVSATLLYEISQDTQACKWWAKPCGGSGSQSEILEAIKRCGCAIIALVESLHSALTPAQQLLLDAANQECGCSFDQFCEDCDLPSTIEVEFSGFNDHFDTTGSWLFSQLNGQTVELELMPPQLGSCCYQLGSGSVSPSYQFIDPVFGASQQSIIGGLFGPLPVCVSNVTTANGVRPSWLLGFGSPQASLPVVASSLPLIGCEAGLTKIFLDGSSPNTMFPSPLGCVELSAA